MCVCVCVCVWLRYMMKKMTPLKMIHSYMFRLYSFLQTFLFNVMTKNVDVFVIVADNECVLIQSL